MFILERNSIAHFVMKLSVGQNYNIISKSRMSLGNGN